MNTIKFYKEEYDKTNILNLKARVNYLKIGYDIQLLLKDRFDEFCADYYSIKNRFLGDFDYIQDIQNYFKIFD